MREIRGNGLRSVYKGVEGLESSQTFVFTKITLGCILVYSIKLKEFIHSFTSAEDSGTFIHIAHRCLT